ncbi:MAG TPA: ferric reductase-like transmembrane domain-containing protein [Streptosporangiaceae bacterium]|nr:ferric reductase-like transmembrane domain-containing protein [Streptosporangiaceae bacterium]
MTVAHVLWYSTRATGIVAFILLTGTVVLGVLGTAGVASERWPRIVTAGLHKNLALTATALVAVHVVTTVLDPFVSISLVAAFVPFTSSYRPIWLSLGAVALDLLLAVIVTSVLRDRLSHRAWRAVHLLVYACWPVALWHALGTGTDTRLHWVLAIDVACMLALGLAVGWRLSLTASARVRRLGLLTLAALALLTAIFVLAGPLQPGWPARAGTPPALLGLHLLHALLGR